jgi:(p)ppGpp synthase/HD superfamily hydrolase
MIDKAIKIVEQAFHDKVDKGGYPYLHHLIRVSGKLEKTDEIVVGLLHDLLEDCKEWTEDDLRLEFPTNIVDAVVCLTKIKGEKYSDYLNRVKNNPLSLVVKISDLEDNMDITRLKELTSKDFERLQKYHKAYKELKKVLNENFSK